jgi:hypothetical protein
LIRPFELALLFTKLSLKTLVVTPLFYNLPADRFRVGFNKAMGSIAGVTWGLVIIAFLWVRFSVNEWIKKEWKSWRGSSNANQGDSMDEGQEGVTGTSSGESANNGKKVRSQDYDKPHPGPHNV